MTTNFAIDKIKDEIRKELLLYFYQKKISTPKNFEDCVEMVWKNLKGFESEHTQEQGGWKEDFEALDFGYGPGVYTFLGHSKNFDAIKTLIDMTKYRQNRSQS